jgi:hypothetical protein
MAAVLPLLVLAALATRSADARATINYAEVKISTPGRFVTGPWRVQIDDRQWQGGTGSGGWPVRLQGALWMHAWKHWPAACLKTICLFWALVEQGQSAGAHRHPPFFFGLRLYPPSLAEILSHVSCSPPSLPPLCSSDTIKTITAVFALYGPTSNANGRLVQATPLSGCGITQRPADLGPNEPFVLLMRLRTTDNCTNYQQSMFAQRSGQKARRRK